MRGNVVRVTIGDYIYRMPGFLENVNVTIDNSNTPWEIVLEQYGKGSENDVRQLPHMVTVQCSFKPILDILPRREKYGDDFVPLIANRDTYLRPPRARNLNTDPVALNPINTPVTPQTLVGIPANIQPQLAAPNTNLKVLPKKGEGSVTPNQNAVVYDAAGRPILNPQGFLGGTNGTKTPLNYGTYY
jgi:hypothetical protein